ncbi:MAG: hypothetical protein ACD_39C00414G0002 [uncultured bacterium]|nr:MAG: hypothetical protein ACD_39C00414G0002 [uncultured bacterium]
MNKIPMLKRFVISIGKHMKLVLWRVLTFPLLAAAELLAGMQKCNSLRSQNDQITKAQAAMNLQVVFCYCGVFFDRLRNNIVSRQIIMGLDILNHVARRPCRDI